MEILKLIGKYKGLPLYVPRCQDITLQGYQCNYQAFSYVQGFRDTAFPRPICRVHAFKIHRQNPHLAVITIKLRGYHLIPKPPTIIY